MRLEHREQADADVEFMSTVPLILLKSSQEQPMSNAPERSSARKLTSKDYPACVLT
jgi:hypothetical protein